MTTATPQAPASETRNCLRCGRKLRSAEAVARGMGRGCWAKVREAEATAAKAGAYSADQQAKAAAAIRSGEVTIEAPGLYGIPSSKGDGTRYASDGASCCCPAGAKDRRCWHLLVAAVLDLAFASRRSAAKRPAPAPAAAPDDVWAALEAVGALDLIPAF